MSRWPRVLARICADSMCSLPRIRTTCLIEGTHSSGSGLQQLLAYMEKFKTQLVVVESVITVETSGAKSEGVQMYDELQDVERIAKSSVEVAVASLQSAGYVGSYLRVNTREFGLPQNRPRMHFIASSRRQTVTLQDMEYRIKLPHLLPMSVFLLDDGDPILNTYRSVVQAPAQVGRKLWRRVSDAASQPVFQLRRPSKPQPLPRRRRQQWGRLSQLQPSGAGGCVCWPISGA